MPRDDAETVLLIDPLPEKISLARRLIRFVGWVLRGIGSMVQWLFGAVTLMVGLAVLAALPVVQFLSLGYLLEAGARVTRSGRVRDGFIGARLAARVGGAVLAIWLLLLPVRLVAGIAYSAQVIEPGGATARAWRFGLVVLIAVTAMHIAAACFACVPSKSSAASSKRRP